MSCNFLDAMQHRFACKLYDRDKKISETDLNNLLKVAQLSPTSFGLEMIHYRVVVSDEYNKGIFKACFEQESVLTAPLVIVPTVLREDYYDVDGEFVKQRALRFPSTLKEFKDDFRGYYNFLKENNRLVSWAKSQTYISIANMMTYAQTIGISSCAIEGYDEDKVLELLKLDKEKWAVGLICCFGYSKENEREKIREDIKDIVTIY